MVNYVIQEQKSDSAKIRFKYPMTVSDIFSIESPKLINLFFEKFEEPYEEENSGFMSVEEDEEEKIPEDLHSHEEDDKKEEDQD